MSTLPVASITVGERDIDQAVIASEVSRDLALLGSIEEIAKLPAEQQPAYITAALVESRKWLHLATESTNPRPFAEIKAWAAGIAEYARQKGLASEIVADGQEMLRRAERAVGQAVRNGQEAGELRRKGQASLVLDQYKEVPSVNDFFGHRNEMTEVYALTDGVSEDEFEDALAEARDEQNLSRANVVRKVTTRPPASTTYAQNRQRRIEVPRQSRDERADLIADLAAKGYASPQMVKHVGVSEETVRQIARDYGIEIPGDKVTLGTRRIDSLKVARETVDSLEGIVSTLSLINTESLRELDPSEATQWVASLDLSLRALNRFNKALKEATSEHQPYHPQP